MKNFIALFIFLFAQILAASIKAQVDHEVTVSWSAPTERENGQALTAEEISKYTICYNLDGASTVTLENSNCQEIGNVNSYIVRLTLPVRLEAYQFRAAVMVTDIFEFNTSLSESVLVDIIVVPDSPPKPPTDVIATHEF